jgi:glutathione peroxidase
MKKQILALITFSFLMMTVAAQNPKTFHDFKVRDIEGKAFDLASLKGKKIMVVNTASQCGLTPQYEDLQKLYSKYASKNFVIIGFPANNFLSQEPGSNSEIKQFCTSEYGVTFPMMEKISVKGDDMEPVYQWLTKKSENGVLDSEIKWNFQKYLIDENGKLVKMISPRDKPDSEEIIQWIEGK